MEDKKETEGLAQKARECADKLRGLDTLIPPPVNNVSVHLTYPEGPWYEDFMNVVASISMTIGFVLIGFAISQLLK
jgi:hypothetical protein